ncbi:MAG: polysaccharide deacetylase family protein [Patescibacteria group bacterium]|nr:polysaccharide deacetylase family protein [Patescibacteria group bacterium]MCL5261811.1 polysaccharide deacetylase family protein [Patescibacteria group bacterium]
MMPFLVAICFISVLASVSFCVQTNRALVATQAEIKAKNTEIVELNRKIESLCLENQALRERMETLLRNDVILKALMSGSVYRAPAQAATEKMVVISFDDLTTSRVTKIIAIANDKQAPLLLFPTGDALRKQPGVFLSAIQSGHVIGNHTNHHDWLGKLDADRARKTLADWDDSASRLLNGYQTIFFRPPAMSGWADKKQRPEFERLVNASGKIPVLWSLETYYDLYAPNGPHRRGPTPTIENEIDYIVKSAKAGDIILFHDTAADVAALPEIIDGLRSRGFVIVSIKTMLGLTS